MAAKKQKYGSWKVSMMVAFVGLSVLFFYSHVRSERKATWQTLARDASRMKIGYESQMRQQAMTPSLDIPPTFWPPSVEALHPLNVYTWKEQILIVQKKSNGGESGIMVQSALSSYRPDEGDPMYRELHLRPISRFVYQYRRYVPLSSNIPR